MQRKGVLFIVSAPSGAGKTTLCREILDIFPGLRHSVSFTTRTPRAGEVHGKDYFFVTVDEFQRMVREGEFAEWAEVHGNFYGTAISTLAESRKKGIDLILDIDCQGAQQLREKRVAGVHVFILPPSYAELRRRLEGRDSDRPEVIETRMNNAAAEIREARRYDYIIVNDQFPRAVEELRSIIIAEHQRTELMLETVAAEFNI